MHPRLLFLFLFLIHLTLLFTHVRSHPRVSSSSNTLLSFVPSSKANLRSIRNLLTRCCRDANLISHNTFTLNQVNILTLPSTQYHTLQSLRPQLRSLPEFSILHSPLSKHNWPRLSRQTKETSTSENFFDKYQNLDDLQAKWMDLDRRYPTVQTTEIGRSIEDRPIFLIRIGSTDPDKPKRVFLNSLQHAREWIAAAAATYVAETLAEASAPENGDDDTLSTMLRSVQVLIVPVVNPDGYVYSHSKGDDSSTRLWRKNRRPLSGECRKEPADYVDRYAPGGVDLNRNWGRDFKGQHSSDDPCDNIYAGTHPFSEPETQALSKLIRNTNGIMAHVDFHSFGQVILGPWASSDNRPNRHCEHDILGKEMEKAMIAASGKRYEYGRGKKFQQGRFAASGVMTDWVHHEFPQTLSYTIELRPKDSIGFEGFKLDEDEIVPASKEAFFAVWTLLRYSSDPEGFFDESPAFSRCRQSTAPPSIPQEEGSSNAGLIAGTVVAVVLAVAILAACIVIIRIRRRTSREKQPEEAAKSPDDNTAKDGGPLEVVCAVVKVPQTAPQSGTTEGLELSSNDTLQASQTQLSVFSTVSNDCITPRCAETPSVSCNTEGGSSYGNTVLLDGQNPFFPDYSIPAGSS